MKTIIIGGVAAGTSAAAKLRRNREDGEITIYEKGGYVSYSTCGMPYFIGRDDLSAASLTPRDPGWFSKRFRIDIHTHHEVLSIEPDSKTLLVRDLEKGVSFSDSYDNLILATGSTAVIPPIEGVIRDHVFPLKTMEDTMEVDGFLKAHKVENAVVIGAGFIGLEIFENLHDRGVKVHLIEAKENLMPAIDDDMSLWIEDYAADCGLNFTLSDSVVSIGPDSVTTGAGHTLKADLVILAVGVRPDTELALNAGIQLGTTGGIKVDNRMNTSRSSIKAVGDCAEVWSAVNAKALYRPMGSTANKMGRVAGDDLGGGSLQFRGVLGTGILKFFDLHIGYSGMTQKEAEAEGFKVEVIHNIKENQSSYLPESEEMVIKAVADRDTGKLLGVQIIGKRGVDKRLDVFVTAMTFGASVQDLFHLDLAYAPPFSTTKDPVMYTGMILSNAIFGNRGIITPTDLMGREEEYQIIDVRSQKDYDKGHIEGALNIPLGKLRDEIPRLDKHRATITHCNKGVTGNAAQNLLLNSGFETVFNISGGFKNYNLYKKYRSRQVSPPDRFPQP